LYSNRNYDEKPASPLTYVGVVFGFIAAAAVIVILLFGAHAGLKSYGRYQARQDANNNAKVTAINERKYTALIEIEKEKAEIRRQEAIGIRDAQETINSTLTPLYVQHEAIQAQEKMINSPNHTVIYIPAGSNGVPFVQDVSPQPVP
jgi:hypothetical protein